MPGTVLYKLIIAIKYGINASHEHTSLKFNLYNQVTGSYEYQEYVKL